ncbi:MAG: hypothetical protein QGG67_08925 [Gammaproteobacteria bacterium]|jgi:hypothetical protein|nr:hypothetical protein [Gammaproteobacteria bacterium]
MDWLTQLLDPGILAVLIPLVAIIGYFVLKGARAYFRHAERMEKIRNGIDPDAYDDE